MYKSITDFLNHPDNVSKKGRVFIPSIFERWQQSRLEAAQQFQTLNLQAKKVLIVTSWIFISLGILHQFRTLLPLGFGFLVFLHLQNRRAWRYADALEVKVKLPMQDIIENEEFNVELTVKNRSSQSVPFALIELPFDGDSRGVEVLILSDIKPRSNAQVFAQFKCDKGWGEYSLDSHTLTVSDELGFYLKSYCEGERQGVYVHPKRSESISKVQVRTANLGSHSGNIELPVAGRSISFYGLRPYSYGDDVKLIDWKKSAKSSEIVIKEFERFSATDATICFDDCIHGHSAFKDLSSMNMMKQATLAVMDRLTQQNIRYRFVSSQFSSPFGQGTMFNAEMSNRLIETKPVATDRFATVVENAVIEAQPYSLFILFFTTQGIKLDDLTRSLLQLVEKNIDPILVMLDSMSFAKQASAKANLAHSEFYAVLSDYFYRFEMKSDKMASVAKRVSERTYLIQPDIPLNSTYDEVKGL